MRPPGAAVTRLRPPLDPTRAATASDARRIARRPRATRSARPTRVRARGRSCSASRHASRRSSFIAPAPAVAEHVNRAGRPDTPLPACRRRAPRAARARTYRCGSGTRTHRRPRRPSQSSACDSTPRYLALRIARLQFRERGPSPATHFEPGKSSFKNASTFFSTATRPTYRKIGRAVLSTFESIG